MKVTRLLLVAVLQAALNACGMPRQTTPSDADLKRYEQAFDSPNDLLVFSVGDLDGGPIKGAIQTDDLYLSVGSPELLMRSLMECGQTRFLIEYLNHQVLVSVPVEKNALFRGTSDLELVKCVQEKSSFSFTAGVGRGLDLDSSPFESLYAAQN